VNTEDILVRTWLIRFVGHAVQKKCMSNFWFIRLTRLAYWESYISHTLNRAC